MWRAIDPAALERVTRPYFDYGNFVEVGRGSVVDVGQETVRPRLIPSNGASTPDSADYLIPAPYQGSSTRAISVYLMCL